MKNIPLPILKGLVTMLLLEPKYLSLISELRRGWVLQRVRGGLGQVLRSAQTAVLS